MFAGMVEGQVATLQYVVEQWGESERLAVVDPSDALTYGELADRVRRMAGLLQSIGVKAGDRVGVQLETTTRTMVAAHAVLRCGAVVVPLDPRAPVALLATIIDECSIDVMLSDTAAKTLDARFDHLGVRHVISTSPLERPGVVSWGESMSGADAALVPVSSDALAYVIFTSGSTGRPKGIAHTHASALSYARLAVATYGIGPNDRIAQPAPMHFDQSTLGLYGAPLSGAAAVMIPEALLAFPASVAAHIAEHRVSIWYSVPTLIMRLVQRGMLENHNLSSLRWVKFGGEVFPPGQLAASMAALPARFSNVYGPAEVNQCTYFHLDRAPDDDAPIPIGRAWDETEVAIVDHDRSPVPPGTEGELVVRSTTAMSGYWGQPELTAQVLRPMPLLGEESLAPWYATGDLCVERPDGEIVFLGRIDNQVKVRGNRVELEAVESALLEIEAIEGVGVFVVAEADGTNRLVALVEGPDSVDQRAIAVQLGESLPRYAVPDEIAAVESLPRTGTGKVDRNATRDQYLADHN